MQTLPQLLRLLSLESIIDSKLLILVLKIAQLYAIALMEARGKNIFVYSSLQIA
ncbi:MAG: hypothetical protein V7K25_28420 [Nostoc sp.]|uniref:hypothetical protein n=1 Tax=Nostoc sp. TaxID=1180 RepID=UPI002FFD4460